MAHQVMTLATDFNNWHVIQDSHGGRKELTPTRCPLIATHVP